MQHFLQHRPDYPHQDKITSSPTLPDDRQTSDKSQRFLFPATVFNPLKYTSVDPRQRIGRLYSVEAHWTGSFSVTSVGDIKLSCIFFLRGDVFSCNSDEWRPECSQLIRSAPAIYALQRINAGNEWPTLPY
ncbi:hypothetical protein AVEN_99662-1 [Araneus ventricosus]|uniref:Uncharacterized protein n=1 Tax=Araneus ventricosus TaxID=182803 RepID=A0A4Y2DPM5_ARAVE|nr:hypothetical protein AVEN_99662-1 [Araneus ventricosus]